MGKTHHPYLRFAEQLIHTVSQRIYRNGEFDLSGLKAEWWRFFADEKDLQIQAFDDLTDFLFFQSQEAGEDEEEDEQEKQAGSGAKEGSGFTVSVFDVAAYILKKVGPISTVKLQLLVYYSQAWSLVWDKAPLFFEPIEAWRGGPVVRSFFFAYCRRNEQIAAVPIGNPGKLTRPQRVSIKAVLKSYSAKDERQLSQVVCMEKPWKNARIGLSDSEDGERIIPQQTIRQYYRSIAKKK